MANSSQGPPGTYPASYSATVPPIAQRSSYAAVLSGAATISNPSHQQLARSGFFSQVANPPSAHGFAPFQYPIYPHTYNRPLDPSHSFGGALQQISEGLGTGHMQHHSNSYGPVGEGAGASMLDHRSPEFFVPSYLKGSKHIERLEEKYRARLTAQREGRSGRSSTGGSLSTSASSMSLPKMIPSHRGMTYDIQEKHFSQTDDGASPLPSRWSMMDRFSGLEVLGDGLEIRYNGVSKTQDEAAAIRADHSIPKQCGVYYFEVTVLSKSKECLIGIGLSGPKVVLNRIPGWEPESWAYHGDDGYSFCETASGKTYGPKYSYSDVIGCGINFATSCVFFTRNGHHLGSAFKEVKTDVLYPTIGMKKPGEQIRVNFGQTPFIYDIDSLVQREKQRLLDEISREDIAHLHIQPDESSLLQELITQYLSHEGFRETAKLFNKEAMNSTALLRGSGTSSQKPEYEEDLDAVNRQRIRAAILEGDIDKALKHTKAYYPNVLQENEHIYFKLRCRKFVEMIRNCTLLQPRSKRSSMHGTSSSYAMNGHRKSLHEDYGDVFDGRMELDDTDGAPNISDKYRDRNDDQLSFDSVAKQNELMSQALQYGQELRAEFKDDLRRETKKELEDTFALIAYPDARDSSLAPLLEVSGRIPVAEELSSAILVSLGKSSSAGLERLVQQTEILASDLGHTGGTAALLNVRDEYMGLGTFAGN